MALCVQLANDKEAVDIIWPDGHQSRFDCLWLNDHQLREGRGHLSSQHYRPPERALWGANELSGILDEIRFSVREIFSEPAYAYKWLNQLQRSGITFLTDAGNEEGMLKKVADHIAFLKRTAYGYV